LKEAYQITILVKKRYYNARELLHWFEYYDAKNGVSLGGLGRIVTMELSKANAVAGVPEMSAAERWAYYLRNVADKGKRERVNEIIAAEEGIRMANNVLMNISRDDAERARLISEFKYELDTRSRLVAARNRVEAAERKAAKRVEKAERKAAKRVEEAEKEAAKMVEEAVKEAAREAVKRVEEAEREAEKKAAKMVEEAVKRVEEAEREAARKAEKRVEEAEKRAEEAAKLARCETAKAFKAMGEPIEKIAMATGLSVDEIAAL
jgi:vacuolar-type H+-ATPase subunit H